jgi:hypothetical protein
MAFNRRTAAFTRKELMVMIAVFVVFGLFFIPAWQRANQKSRSTACINNLKNSRGNPAGRGNILLGDGSAQQATSSMGTNLVKKALGEQAAWNYATNPPGLRLIFP